MDGRDVGEKEAFRWTRDGAELWPWVLQDQMTVLLEVLLHLFYIMVLSPCDLICDRIFIIIMAMQNTVFYV